MRKIVGIYLLIIMASIFFVEDISAHKTGKFHHHHKHKKEEKEKEKKEEGIPKKERQEGIQKPEGVIKRYKTAENLLEVSYDVKILKNTGAIDFSIHNNASRPIRMLFGSVYRLEEDENKKVINKILVNNPHASAILLDKLYHKDGTLALWRFHIYPRWLSENNKYILSVESNSIFY